MRGNRGNHPFSLANRQQRTLPRFQRDVEQHQGLVLPDRPG